MRVSVWLLSIQQVSTFYAYIFPYAYDGQNMFVRGFLWIDYLKSAIWFVRSWIKLTTTAKKLTSTRLHARVSNIPNSTQYSVASHDSNITAGLTICCSYWYKKDFHFYRPLFQFLLNQQSLFFQTFVSPLFYLLSVCCILQLVLYLYRTGFFSSSIEEIARLFFLSFSLFKNIIFPRQLNREHLKSVWLGPFFLHAFLCGVKNSVEQ